ncbi:MAG: ribosome silencing factor [Gemmatimonadetes bacterium]|jgi:ribosome-associated protein|nr:MAG: ribosome silencing factor [Gemmatimonadota bacterium]
MTSRRSGRPAGRAGDDALAALRLVTAALADRKAIEPTVLDLRGLTAAADYFVIVSGTSDAHVRGMAEHLLSALAPRGLVPHHVEGLTQGRWVLLDYVDFVVHVFHPELRQFYQLERLWGDAPVLAGTALEGQSKG